MAVLGAPRVVTEGSQMGRPGVARWAPASGWPGPAGRSALSAALIVLKLASLVRLRRAWMLL